MINWAWNFFFDRPVRLIVRPARREATEDV
jgi:hypothetical protein